jgi:cyclopropane fatty-acyl-phospholipid synthase-like methyltransferase
MILNDLNRLVPKATSLLDVGCGWGSGFLRIAKSYYPEIVGLEPNHVQAQYVSGKIDVSVKAESYHADSFPPSRFDIISFIQVMEHLTDPIGAMNNAYKHLKDGGIMVVEVPSYNNPRVLLYQLTRISRIAKVDFIRPHLFYFTPKTLSRCAVASGFVIEGIRTGSYAVKAGLEGVIGKSIDRLADLTGIGGITLYARKTDLHASFTKGRPNIVR